MPHHTYTVLCDIEREQCGQAKAANPDKKVGVCPKCKQPMFCIDCHLIIDPTCSEA